MTTIGKEKVYYLDEKGEYIGIKKDYTGTSVFRYELAQRRSTNEFTGYMRMISTTTVAPEMEAGKLRFEYVPFYYDVAPKSMERQLSVDKLPSFVSKEM